jgi:glutamyl-tRNA synthetase
MTTKNPVRVRFAPSPTGMLHIGGVRTALYNYLFAKKMGGEFLLRIENTDTGREVASATEQIKESLELLGLLWDGEVSFQTDRFAVARELAERLVDEGKAYEEVDPEKGTAIRFRVPEGVTSWIDGVKGEISVPNKDIKDFVILRADGTPLYNFASPIDDALDKITHVIRGDDHVSNTPKQILLLKALGFDIPTYAHIPMVAGSDGRKLSKRHGATGLQEFLGDGYLPETMINFLALIGWAPGDGETKEFFSLDELVEWFDLAHVGEALGRFDYDKLKWMNGHYLREKSVDDFAGALSLYLAEQGYRYDIGLTYSIAPLVQEKIATLGEFPSFAGYFYARPHPDLASIDFDVLQALYEALSNLEDFTSTSIGESLKSACEAIGVKPRNGLRTLYGAITGAKVGASIFHSLEILGRKESLTRIHNALSLGGNRDAALERVSSLVSALERETKTASTIINRNR